MNNLDLKEENLKNDVKDHEERLRILEHTIFEFLARSNIVKRLSLIEEMLEIKAEEGEQKLHECDTECEKRKMKTGDIVRFLLKHLS